MVKFVANFFSMEVNVTAANNACCLRFCSCSQLSYEQIANFCIMNVNGIVTNQVSNNLFKRFLRIGHRSDKTNALLLVECFELADKMLNDFGLFKEYFDDLIELCPSYLWEQRLEKAEKEKPLLGEVLKALKKECLCSIEGDHDFIRFKQNLLRKIC